MPTHILVPLDGSSFGEQALRYAGSIAARAKATLHLVKAHALQPGVFVPDVPLYMGEASDAQGLQSDADYLDQIAAGLRAKGQCVRTAVLQGPPAGVLAEYVAQAGIDLVIMATHGRGGLSRAWLGSVADRLVRSINTPVVLLKPRAGGPEVSRMRFAENRILIPLDGSEASEAVLECAVALGSLIDAQYTLMQVTSPPPVHGVPGVYEQDAEYARRESTRYLEGVAERLRARGCLVRTAVVMQTQSAMGILEQALVEDCNLIAMATHGRTGLTRIALGSVTDKVVRTAPVPVLVCPAAPASTSAGAATFAISA